MRRDYKAVFQDFGETKEKVQNSFLRLACEIEPKIVESLPLESYLHLTRNHRNLKTDGAANEVFHYSILPLLFQDIVSADELRTILPNADNRTIANDFSIFRRQFFDWAKKYCFEKDWIIKSAISTLAYRRKVFIEGGKQLNVLTTFVNLSLNFGYSEKDIVIQEKIEIYSENWTDFENRIKHKMKELKKRYAEEAKKHTFKTKDFEVEKLRWLVWWNIRELWTAHDIAINDDQITNKTYDQKVKQIYNTIEDFKNGRLKKSDLPVRDKY